jgi:hypothetical protein
MMEQTMNSSSVSPLELSLVVSTPYDAFLTSAGFEERCRYVAKVATINAEQNYAFAFMDRREGQYGPNLAFFRSANFEINELDDDGFREWVRSWLRSVKPRRGSTVHIVADISAMTRTRIAALIFEVAACMHQPGVVLDILYAPARFKAPGRSIVIDEAMPVLPELSGWPGELSSPLVTIFGLGHELDRALGALDYFEPYDVYGYYTGSTSNQFLKSIARSNRAFFKAVDRRKIISYEVDRPYELCVDLGALVRSIRSSSVTGPARPMIVPFGPKIFCACAVAVALNEYPTVGVWRISEGRFARAVDQIAAGPIVGLRFASGEAALNLQVEPRVSQAVVMGG